MSPLLSRLSVARGALALARLAPPTPVASALLEALDEYLSGARPNAEPEHRRSTDWLAEAADPAVAAAVYCFSAHAAVNAANAAIYLSRGNAIADCAAMARIGEIPSDVAAAIAAHQPSGAPSGPSAERVAARRGAYRMCAVVAELLPAPAREQLEPDRYWGAGRCLPRNWLAVEPITDEPRDPAVVEELRRAG